MKIENIRLQNFKTFKDASFKDIPAGVVAVGNPCRVVKTIKVGAVSPK